MKVGVLGFQGDFARHMQVLAGLGVPALLVRRPEEVAAIDALILPGGESTTIGKLMEWFGLMEPVRERVAAGMPILGTCAGAILLAREIVASDQSRIGAMDIAVARNAYGRQIESFEADINVPAIGDDPVRGVFIRAPIISRVGEGLEVLAVYEGNPVVVRQDNCLVATFHPELTGDTRIHAFFLDRVATRTTLPQEHR